MASALVMMPQRNPCSLASLAEAEDNSEAWMEVGLSQHSGCEMQVATCHHECAQPSSASPPPLS